MTQSYSPGDLSSLFGSKPVIYNPKKQSSTTVGTKRPAAIADNAQVEPSKKRVKLSSNNKDDNKNNNNKNNHNKKSNKYSSQSRNNSDTKTEAFYPNLKLKANIGRGRGRVNTRQERRMKHVSKMKHIRLEKKLKRQKGHRLSQIEKLTENELDDRREKTQRTLFIGNIPHYWKKKHVINFLSKWSKFIEEIYFSNYIKAKTKYINKQMKNKGKNKNNLSFLNNMNHQIAENKSNKNAWVRFKSKEYVNEAISLNNSVINGKFTLRVDFADPSLNRNNDKCVFIGGLPISANEEDIRNHFKFKIDSQNTQKNEENENENDNENNENGDCIINVRILRNPQSQISRGCGFIEFDTVENVSKALDLHLSKFPIPNFDELNDNDDDIDDLDDDDDEEEEEEDDDVDNDGNKKRKRKRKKRKKKKKPYKIIRVVPCVKNPQQLCNFCLFVCLLTLWFLVCKDDIVQG